MSTATIVTQRADNNATCSETGPYAQATASSCSNKGATVRVTATADDISYNGSSNETSVNTTEVKSQIAYARELQEQHARRKRLKLLATKHD